MSTLAYGMPRPPRPIVPPPYQVIVGGHVFAGGGRGRPDDAGIYRVFDDLVGWWDPTESTGEIVQNAYQSGGWPDDAYENSRNLALKGTIFGDDRPAVRNAFEEFLGSLSVRELSPFVVIEHGLTRHVMARRQGKPITSYKGFFKAAIDVQFAAPDYRRLSGDGSGPTHVVETGLPTQSGGLAFPAVFPATFDADVVTGVVEITNAGTAPPPVTVTIHGPSSSPIIRTDDGQQMPLDITLDVGQFLEVDLDRKTIKLNGQASRRSALRGKWINLRPDNVLMFDAVSYNPETRFVVSWYDAWK